MEYIKVNQKIDIDALKENGGNTISEIWDTVIEIKNQENKIEEYK